MVFMSILSLFLYNFLMKIILNRILAYCIETIAPIDPLIAGIEKSGTQYFYTHTPYAEMIGYTPHPKVIFYSLLAYKHELVKAAILEVKSYGYKPIARILAWGIREHLLSYTKYYPQKVFFIIPIPITRKSLSIRGFNQCELIIRECFNILDSSTLLFNKHFILRTDILFKVKNTSDQVGRNHKERQENLRDCFIVNTGSKITDASIIIFDDILTTGATLHEAIRALEPHKPQHIYALTIAH